RYDNITYPHDILPGVLLENGKVFVAHGEIGVHDCEQLPSRDFVLVDLDVNDVDHIEGIQAEALVNLVAGEMY
ncbi:MAG: hypothetical protein AB2401_12725, partial [Bacillus sp. (in: firmicutes)]